MRRDLNEIENEILRRRDEYRVRKEKRERTARTLVPVLSGAALAVIAAIALPALLGRSPSMKPGADPSYAVSTAGPSVNLPGDIDSSAGSGSYGSDSCEPQAGETELVYNGSNGITVDPPDLPGWYCGTPIVNANLLDWRPGDAVPVNAVPDGGMLHWRFADTNNVIEIGKEQAAELFALLGALEPGEPYSEEDDKSAAFVFELFFGGKQLQTVGFEDGSYLLNGEGCYTAPRDTQRRLGELIERIESGFFCTGG